MGFKPNEVLFSPTHNCNLNCSHCNTVKSKKVLPIPPAKRFLAESKRLGVRRVGFTGGEPFLAMDFLTCLVEEASREGMAFDKIMTNGVWYKDEDDLEDSLRALYKAGYDGSICISVDALHKQSSNKVARFIEVAAGIWKKADLISLAYVSGVRDEATQDKLEGLFTSLKKRRLDLIIKIFKIDLSPVGKASGLKEPWRGKWFREDRCKVPGNVFFVESDGSVRPCCGYADSKELIIGNVKRDSAENIMKNARNNRFVSAVFGSGLSRIRKKLERLGVRFPGKASSHCYFCQYILTKIPKKILKKALALFFLAILSTNAFASEPQVLRKAKDYKSIPVRIIRKIDIPRGYHEGLFYDGKNIWLCNGKGGKIWVIETSSGTVTRQVGAIAGFTEGMTKITGEDYLVTDWYEKKIYRARIENDSMMARSEASLAPAYPAGVLWNSPRIFVIIWTRGLGTKFDLVEMDEALKIVKKTTIKNIHEPAHLAWDGRYIWITSWFNRAVYKVDIDKLEIAGYFRSPVSKTTGIAWDGRYFWITGTYSDLYQVEMVKD